MFVFLLYPQYQKILRGIYLFIVKTKKSRNQRARWGEKM
jgi:hypothetical protein